MKTKFVSPGVYVKEVDISYYTPPKNLIRIRKIKKIFRIDVDKYSR
jgi:hypothetical protein